jgi:hypothetical protein
MISWFSGMMDYAVDAHFRKDRSGRLVFVPYSLKRNCYFVDSQSDAEKIRALVRMYRSAVQMISILTSPSLIIPALILEDYAGLSPRGHRMTIALGIPLFFWLVLIALLLLQWSLYKGAIPSLTASLIEVGPELKGQLRGISQRAWRTPLLLAAAGLLLMVFAIFAIVAAPHFRR